MSEASFIVLSALFLAIPIGVKYLLAFQTRALVETLRRQEHQVQLLTAQLEAAERECLVVRRAMHQMVTQQRQAQRRRQLLARRLEQLRQTTPAAEAQAIAA